MGYTIRDTNIFKTELFEGAELVGSFGMPKLKPTKCIPHDLIPFNQAKTEKVPESKWIHFFINDYQFERVWNYPQKYISLFERFEGIISTDYSMYTSMPKAQLIWNCFRNRAVAYWLQSNGFDVVPVVEWAIYSDFSWCLDGLPKQSTLAIGTYGSHASSIKKYGLIKGIERICIELEPTALICYGSEIKSINSLCPRVIWEENYCKQMKKRI